MSGAEPLQLVKTKTLGPIHARIIADAKAWKLDIDKDLIVPVDEMTPVCRRLYLAIGELIEQEKLAGGKPC